ncbi:UDP-N-acetylglucosamine:LPS N-acetylglucosamine transferase [Gracilibacillus orientalis]|uniref:UDP-N-acetylglucosamine:LPS N-acetylglucosamine transferase n=1 Tax=Gracilibacillus orientalis TaxID=334253 RepID=A0A1I4L4C1_9BACI|nr:glycosyltransferase [Gracilibacillus orientalis]SFL85860.1 UDP-N-acetylglucosamine:LPS N-acetylglucosamine transferase [Gracilibacillus orientalis]
MTIKSTKILFLPFLNIPSGHHQVADSLMYEIELNEPRIKCEKAEILSYSYGKLEALVSGIYLKWIHLFPHLYNWIYQQSVYKNIEQHKKFRLYELLFLAQMKQLINEKQPDCVICTHALPSYMLNVMKEKGIINIPVINVYTDFFIHRFWGTNHIDFHFVSSPNMKELLEKKGIPEERIWFTGIPVHHEIKPDRKPVMKHHSSCLSIMVTGGNLGVGAMEDLLNNIKTSGKIKFYVLCGKNNLLYRKLQRLNNTNIIPLKYITCRKEMNELYDSIDGILTKPGGVTISECLRKRKPTFIYHALPGQEVINLDQLQQLGVVFYLSDWRDIESQLFTFFDNNEHLVEMNSSLESYHRQLVDKRISELIQQIL